MIRCFVLAALVMALPAWALAAPIVVTFEGTIGGSIDGVDFSNQPFVLTATGDTEDVVPVGGLEFELRLDPNAVDISLPGLNGGTTLNVTTNTFLIVNNGNGYFGITDEFPVSYGVFLANNAFRDFDLASSIGPVSGTGQTGSAPSFETDGGVFRFAIGAPTITATATVIPEPASLALLGLGGLTLTRGRRSERLD